MNAVDQATATQLKNIEQRLGKSLEELAAFVRGSGLAKHGEIRKLLQDSFGLGYGDANTLAHLVQRSDGASQAADQGLDEAEVLDNLYTGPKADLRPIHEALMTAIRGFGVDFEVAPKKGYVSLRRLPAGRLVEQPAGGMCNYKVRLSQAAEVDAELLGWVRAAFDGAG
mgnify:CR=1 FL=1